MMVRVFILLSFVLLGIPSPVSAQDWEPLGPNDWNWPSIGKAYHPRLALDPNGNPVIVATDYGEDGGIHARRWDGSKWIALGTAGFFPAGSNLSNLVLDEAGNPVLVGTDPSNGGRLMARRWNGTSWASIGDGWISPASITRVKLAKDESGRYVVAYCEEPWDRRITVKRWNGSVWETIGDEGFSDPGANYGVSLALNPAGDPVVAYQAYPGIHLTRVQRWTGAEWETLPPINLGNYPVAYTDLALDDGGNPIVVLSNWWLGRRPVVMRWDGTTWETLGPTGISVGNCTDVQIDIDALGRPVVFYIDYDDGTYIRRWNGTVWEVACVIDPQNGLQSPQMALDANDDFVVAGQSGGLGMRSHAQRWNGAEWREYGERGFTQSGAYFTNMAMDRNGEIVVAYSDLALDNRITVQRWNQNAWDVIGPAGFSAGQAAHVDVVLDSLANPVVAFADAVNNGISVMRWNGNDWLPIGPLGITNEYPAGISLGLDPDSNPVIAYKVSAGIENFYVIKVIRWDGSTWSYLGQFPAHWGQGRMGFALDRMGYPTIGLHSYSVGGSIVVQWDGTAWNQLTPVSTGFYYPAFGCLILDANDTPIVSSNGMIQRWNGLSWQAIGSDWNSTLSFICLAIDDNNDVIAGGLDRGRATVQRWNGRYWQAIGSARFTTSFSDFQGAKWLQTDRHGRLVVAYTNGGMYAKSIEYSMESFAISTSVLNLGPNPNNGEELWISLGGLPASTEWVEVMLHDMSGRRVSVQSYPVAHGEINTRLTLPPGLANGMYVISADANKRRRSERLVIAKP